MRMASPYIKVHFVMVITLRYGWLPSNIPSTCTCGKFFTVEHTLSCPLGGFPSIRHNEIRDLTESHDRGMSQCFHVRITSDMSVFSA